MLAIRQCIVLLITVLISISACSEENKETRNFTISQKNANYLQFAITLNDGVKLTNIVYEQDKIFKKWLLQFKAKNGFNVIRKNADNSRINAREYSEVLDYVLFIIQREYPNGSLTQVQTDFSLVEETNSLIISAIKETASTLSGPVVPKNNRIDEAVIQVIKNSEQMEETCLVFKKYHIVCDREAISINPIAFKTEYLKKDWPTIQNLTDAGIKEEQWFGIDAK